MHDEGTPRASADKGGEQAPLPDHVARNVRAVTEMQLEAERQVNVHQRAVENATALLGRPASLYLMVVLVVAWVVVALLTRESGLGAWDPPPFHILQGFIGLAALLVATMVLITQNRQAKAGERHMHLDLQLNLLTEQRTAKLIQLMEELRRDLPNVRNRHDAEVDLLKEPAETLKVIAAIEEHALEAVREAVAGEREAGRAALREAAAGEQDEKQEGG